jgi:hypothetical protein
MHRFVIDVWGEPREIPDQPTVIRARVRDVADEEEAYVGSVREIERLISARLDAAGLTPRRWERDS